jgi:hypothetical protein
MTATATIEDHLHSAQDRLRNARKARTRAREAIDAARQARDADAEANAQRRLDDADYEIDIASQLESGFLSRMAGRTLGSPGSPSPFLADPETIALLERLAFTQQPAGRVELGSMMSPHEMCSIIESGSWASPRWAASTVPDTAVGRRGDYVEGPGVVPQPRRRLSILDLIRTGVATGNTVPYIIESGSFDTAAETAESAVKPVADIGLTDAELPVRTIAHYLKSPRQILSDVPGLELVLRTRLIYGVMRRLELQVLSGDSTGQNLRGILNTTGVGNIAFSAGTPLGDMALQGLVAELNAEGQADACVMNATTLQHLLTPKASTAGTYLNIGDGGPITIGADGNYYLWGCPIVISTAMTTDQVLFGAFAEACQVWVLEAANVVAGLDSDDLTRNKVTLLGEGRFCCTVNVPSWFTLVHLA